MSNFLPDRRIQTRLHELGMAAALEFINGAQSDISIVERHYTLDASRVEVTDIVKNAALALHEKPHRDCWAVDVDSETCVIRIGKLPEKIEMLYDRWKDMGGADIVLTIEAREHLRTMLGDNVDSVGDLLALIKKRLMPPPTE